MVRFGRIDNLLSHFHDSMPEAVRHTIAVIAATRSFTRLSQRQPETPSRKRQSILDRRGNADTNYLPLESHHEAELALLLHRQGFLGRLIRRQGRGESIRAINTR
jgi:hypothetical protein